MSHSTPNPTLRNLTAQPRIAAPGVYCANCRKEIPRPLVWFADCPHCGREIVEAIEVRRRRGADELEAMLEREDQWNATRDARIEVA